LRDTPFQYQLVYFLCHAKGAGTTDKPSLRPSKLQLVDGSIDAVELRESIKHRFDGRAPLIFINACRGGQLGTLVYHNQSFAAKDQAEGRTGRHDGGATDRRPQRCDGVLPARQASRPSRDAART
jgi:hypothetical protein